ncbi:MAG: hypothetical protein LBL72_08400 [Candidatus Accumulibacter sp.]|nr:hypothetical protein [Accumulibacter sp.]
MLSGIGTLAGGLLQFAKNANEAVQKVANLSKKYRLETELVQLAGTLVAESGGSFEGAAEAIGKLKKAQNEAIHGNKDAAAAFRGVGISVEELKTMKPEDILMRMSDAFSGSNNDLAKQAVLLRLMGKNGESMMDSLNMGGNEWRQKLKEMREDGRIYSKEQIEASTRFDSAWNRAVSAFEGIKDTLGVDLAENLVPVINAIREWAVANKKVISEGFGVFIAHLPRLLDAVVPVAKVLWKVFEKLAGTLKFVSHFLGMENSAWLAFGIIMFKPITALVSLTSSVGELIGVGNIAGRVFEKLAGKTFQTFAMSLGGDALSAVRTLSSSGLPGLASSLNGINSMLARTALLAAAAFIGWKIGGFLNEKINAWVKEKTGGKYESAGAWAYDKINKGPDLDAKITPEEIARARADRKAPTASDAVSRMTAADAAAIQKQDIKNTVDLNIKIDGPGSATVTNLDAGSPQTTINAKTGLSLQGA